MTAEALPSETTRYLITELETVVNDEYLNLLRDSSHHFSVRGYRPPYRYNAPDIIGLELDNVGLVPNELEGIDVNFSFPASDPYGGIKDYVIKWRNGVNWTYAETEQFGPLAYAGHGNRIIGEPNLYRADDIPTLATAAGLPFEEMAGEGPQTLENLLAIFSQQSQWMHLTREKRLALNPFSSLRIVQDSLLLRDEEAADPQVIQELRLEVRHYEDFAERVPAATLLNVPTSYPVRAQHIVFHRDQAASQWVYYASYDGPIKPGELHGEYTESIDQLIAPPTRLAIQINEALENMPA